MKRIRTAFVLLLFFLVTILLSACEKAKGNAEDNAAPVSQDEVVTVKSYTFGFSGISMHDPFFVTLEAALREEIEKAGHTMLTRDPDQDSERQIMQIEELMAEGIDALFLSPVDWQAISPAIEKLKESGIRIINVDSKVRNVEDIDAYIGSDHKLAGILCGKNLVEQSPEGGKVAIFESVDVYSVTERITGFEEVISQAQNGFMIAARRDVKGNKDLARSAAEEVFKNDRDIKAVMCGNDQIALGVLAAAKSLGIQGVRIYGVDGSPQIKKELEKNDSLIAGTAAQSPINIGQTAANVGLALLADEEYEKETSVKVSFIDRENVDLYGVDGWQ